MCLKTPAVHRKDRKCRLIHERAYSFMGNATVLANNNRVATIVTVNSGFGDSLWSTGLCSKHPRVISLSQVRFTLPDT